MPQTQEQQDPTPKTMALWFDAASDLISSIGHDDFLSLLSRTLSQALPSEFLIVFLDRQEAAPALLYDTVTIARHRKGLTNYLENTYILNPFYQAVRKGIEAGVYCMRDFNRTGNTYGALEQKFRISFNRDEEIGFLTDGWPSGMQELLIVIPLNPASVITVSLSRKESGGGFSSDDIADLKHMFPFLQSVMTKHWEFASHRLAPELQAPLLEHRFLEFGQGNLSEREQQVVRMILLGHSSTSIALNLEIALPTVKSHRRNAYSKLGISSQAELFALFVKTVRRSAK
jgi:DNA-binding CsgD family transcriptional regulator